MCMLYSETPLMQAPLMGPTQSVLIKGVSLFQGLLYTGKGPHSFCNTVDVHILKVSAR